MSKILALCETPYQIIVVSKIVTTFYKDYEVDIIITNNIKGGKELVERLKKSKIFKNSYYLQTKNIKRNRIIDPIINYINKYVQTKRLLEKEVCIKSKYDIFLFCNIDIVVQHIINFLNQRSKVKVLMFEDGLSSYTDLYGWFFRKYSEPTSILDKIKYHFLRGNFALTEGIYVFNPQYIKWNAFFPVLEIPKITKDDKKLINELNNIFLYKDFVNDFDCKYIFFEESYYADGYDVNDIEIVEEISNIVGKENILVKIHPRSPIDRFREYGYKTNSITSTPWEIIALNIDLKDKVLITIASGSAINPIIIMGININAIMLFKYKDLKVDLLTDLIDIIDFICINNPDQYSLPEDYNQLKHLLSKQVYLNDRTAKNGGH